MRRLRRRGSGPAERRPRAGDAAPPPNLTRTPPLPLLPQTRRAAAAAGDPSVPVQPKAVAKGKTKAPPPPSAPDDSQATESDAPPVAAARAPPANGAGGSTRRATLEALLPDAFLRALDAGAVPPATGQSEITSLARRLKAVSGVGGFSCVPFWCPL